MLGKTANGLYWMYRYLERAENTARLIETGQRMELTRLSSATGEWASLLRVAGSLDSFNAHQDEIARDTVTDWMLRGKDNPSSVLTSIVSARQNARLVRTAITGEVWEAVNSAYMAIRDALARRVPQRDMPGRLRMIRQHAALVRGVTLGTMMRNEIWDFARLGTFTERADNTARLLDVKYYVLLPSVGAVGSSLDNVQWDTILSAVSGRGGFRMTHGGHGGPREIAQFLILDKRMPRSLAFSVSKLGDNLGYLCDDSGVGAGSRDRVTALAEGPLALSIDEIFEQGLHEFLQSFLSDLALLSGQIEQDFRFYR